MREIKFRYWCKFENKMYEKAYVDEHLSLAFMSELIETAQARYVFQQYTGLKDKNGREIYENDIIYWEINNGVGIESYTAVVKWSEYIGKGWEGCYKWLVGYTENYLRGDYDELSTPAAYNDALVVLGNIYENPELLAGEDK